MTLDHNLYSEAPPSYLPTGSVARSSVEDALGAFEDRLWQAAETIVASGASSISVVAETASIVRRHSAAFASFLAGVNHMKTLGEDAGPINESALKSDIANAEARLLRQLREDLANL